MQAQVVTADDDRLLGQLQLPPVIGRRDPGVAGDVDDQPGHVDGLGLQRPARVEPGKQQQLVDELAHPGRLRLDPAERVRDVGGQRAGMPARQLRIPADGGERGAKLMAGVGGEGAQPRLAGLAAGERGLRRARASG